MKRSPLEEAWRDVMKTCTVVGNIPGMLPHRGQIRSPDGLVHRILGNFTWCDVKWVATSSFALDTCELGWMVVDTHVTCIECAGEL